MELPNKYFQDFPIEFKEINPSDFPSFDVKDKIIIEPDEFGFINDTLQEQICLEENNTVVINASVGNGKSYAIIQTIKRYYESQEKYLIVVATPFVSLVEQYIKDIHRDAEIPMEDIFDYTFIGNKDKINYLERNVHVVTVNTLLGNPGEDAFKTANSKRKYINDIINHCYITNTKVIFVYDEIHDAIKNFREEYIFNLWKWRDVIHKNFIISATFNEASKVVIKYLAELTQKKIEIIEAKRVRFPEKQSKLYLHYSQDYNFSVTTKVFVKLIDDLLYRNKNIDILCYSKSLAKSIIEDNQGVGLELKKRFGEVNSCISMPISNQKTTKEPKNRFNNDKCNIGTNFKTGVSIKKDNPAFVIIMPPRSSRIGIRNRSGIFSDGVNSVIQALARQRTPGEIHIVLPNPDCFDYSTLIKSGFSEEQMNAFKKKYDKVRYYEESKMVKYHYLQEQDEILRRFYHTVLKPDVIEEIQHISSLNRRGLPRLKYPTYELFKLSKGEDYLANKIKFYGEDLSAYITYCAFTNQFINCNLSGIINNNESLFFEPGIIQGQLAYYFNKYFGGEEGRHALFKEWKNFNKVYQDFREDLFQNFKLRYRTDNVSKYMKLKPFESYFEIQLLKFVESMYYGFDFKTNDIQYSRGDYFLDCIFIAQQINLEEKGYDKKFVSKIKFYQTLGYFREKIIQSVKKYTSDKLSYDYLENALPDDWFTYKDIEMFDILKLLLPNDDLLHSNVFIYKRNLNRKSFYKKLIEDFFETSDAKLPIGNRKNVKKIIKITPLPLNTSIINLVEPPEDLYTDELENAHIEIMGAENHKNSQQEIDQRLREY